jgi:hypothetical protein
METPAVDGREAGFQIKRLVEEVKERNVLKPCSSVFHFVPQRRRKLVLKSEELTVAVKFS